jgi:hypothetical protein
MSQKTSAKSDRQWAALFSETVSIGSKPQGSGWFTFDELRRKHNIGSSKMRGVLNALRFDGRVETFSGAERLGGVTCRRLWYRIIESKNKPKKV